MKHFYDRIKTVPLGNLGNSLLPLTKPQPPKQLKAVNSEKDYELLLRPGIQLAPHKLFAEQMKERALQRKREGLNAKALYRSHTGTGRWVSSPYRKEFRNKVARGAVWMRMVKRENSHCD